MVTILLPFRLRVKCHLNPFDEFQHEIRAHLRLIIHDSAEPTIICQRNDLSSGVMNDQFSQTALSGRLPSG